MFFKILLKYLYGYIKIKVEGYYTEKFINKCISNKIFFWNIKREKSSIVYMNVGIKDFKRLCEFAKASKCKIKILEKKGMPFVLHRYKKRKMFVALLILFAVGLIILSQFVWKIQVEGLNKIDEDEIIQLLSEKGLNVGKLKNKIDKQKIINEVRLERPDIAWIGISVEGTNAVVKVAEAEAKPEIVNDDDYCNIIADKNAQIVKISAQNGIPQVKEGDMVTKDDVLIAGWIEGKYTGTRYVHAEGEITAKVWYSQKEKVETKQIIKTATGNTEEKYKIKINNFTINLFKTLSKFEKYDTIEADNNLKIFSSFYLPITISKIKNSEIKEEEVIYEKEEAKQIAINKASEKLNKAIKDESKLLQKYINTNEADGYMEVEVTYEVLENIGIKEKIVF